MLNLLICQLSDIHFRADRENIIMGKVDKIADVILSNVSKGDACFIVFSGDIAYSGKDEEYEIALSFVLRLLESVGDSVDINLVAVPGNHDCNFLLDDDTRRAILEVVATKESIDNSIVDNSTRIQGGFFDFVQSFQAKGSEIKGNKIHAFQEFNVFGKKILFNLMNTAWMSQKNEKQGKLIIPRDFIIDIDANQYDLVISVFHHPYNWFESNNKRLFKDCVEKMSDIIITGHEHSSEMYSVSDSEYVTNDYYLGGVLQSDSSHNSDFNILIINVDEKKYLFQHYEWDKKIYSPTNPDPTWRNFKRNMFIEKQSFNFKEDFYKKLSDIGANFSHPNKENVVLDDLFIYPNLRLISSENLKTECKIVDSRKFENYIYQNKKLLITGEEKCGKSTFAKKLLKDLHDQGIVGVLVDAKDFNDADSGRILRTIQRYFSIQYEETLFEQFKQLPKNKKVIIVDDFHKSKLNAKGKSIVLTYLLEKFDYVIVFADNSFRTEQLLNQGSLNNSILNITNYVLMDFGHYLRSRLIKKWVVLGNEFLLSQEEVEVRCVESERMVNNLLGRNLLPSYPIFILMVLQQLESTRKALNPSQSSYGYLYGALITSCLMNINKAPDDVDMYYAYLSELAFYLFSSKQEIINKDDIYKVTELYNQKYRMRISENVIDKLVGVRLLEIVGTEEYRFKYKYIFYYFVAKYLADEINNEENRTLISNMCEKLYNGKFANIMMFLCHLSKDPFIINELLNKSRNLFIDFIPYDFDNHLSFIDKIYEKLPELLPTLDNPKVNRDKSLKEKDDYERNVGNYKFDDDDEEQQLDNNIGNVLTVNKAFKTIEILGQIVKNFPGSIKAELKYEVLLECYLLGMRTLNMFLNLIDSNFDEFTLKVKDWIQENEIDDKKVAEEKWKELILILTENVSFGVIQKISESVGNNKLEGTYEEILQKNNATSFELIDVSIKLECLKFPQKRTLELAEKLEDNLFSLSILKRMVFNHFYLYSCDYDVKQRICEKLQIPYSKMTLLEGGGRKQKKL